MIDTLDKLRARYGTARERSVKKELTSLDAHCVRLIGLSPFLVMASSSTGGTGGAGDDGMLDASPRGGAPGFVKVRDAQTLLIPDASGNNRLDTFTNIIETGRVGLLFFVPGMDETLRVNGRARLRDEAEFFTPFAQDAKPPKLVIEVTVTQAYLHCAKALMRSKLWDARLHLNRATLPSMGEMMRDQIGGDSPAETQAEMLLRYQADL